MATATHPSHLFCLPSFAQGVKFKISDPISSGLKEQCKHALQRHVNVGQYNCDLSVLGTNFSYLLWVSSEVLNHSSNGGHYPIRLSDKQEL